jgi:hypothetical protein
VEIFAEEELECLLGHFFDWLEEHLVDGYETAWRKAHPSGLVTAVWLGTAAKLLTRTELTRQSVAACPPAEGISNPYI